MFGHLQGVVVQKRFIDVRSAKDWSRTAQIRTTNSGAPPRLTKHAMIEVAIQLDLITPEQAGALVKRGRRSESG